MEIKKVYVNRNDDTALLECPYCGTAKTRHVGKFKGGRRRVKVRCSCQSAFGVLFEFRKAYRRPTYLRGHYVKLPGADDGRNIVVRDISMTGIGLLTNGTQNLSRGDKLQVRFTLDDRARSEIEKDAVVRWAQDRYVGCEFLHSEETRGTDEAALSFYLMPQP